MAGMPPWNAFTLKPRLVNVRGLWTIVNASPRISSNLLWHAMEWCRRQNRKM